jgi:hypothetical protein
VDNKERAHRVGRAEVLADIAADLQKDQVLPPDRIVLRAGRISVITKSYFVLRNAYCRWRIAPGHKVQLPKLAALQSLCIKRVEPF